MSTNIGKEFIGTLEPIADSASVSLKAVPDAVAAPYAFAINKVSAIDSGVITFLQEISSAH